MPRRLFLLAAILLATPALAWGEGDVLYQLPGEGGVARLIIAEGGRGQPLAIFVPDDPDADDRAELYLDALAARGIAALVLGLGRGGLAEGPRAPEAAQALRDALEWAAGHGFDPARTALVGFGAGGRLALAHGVPAVALYPGCRNLPAPRAPALVLQGGRDAEGCDALPDHPLLTLEVLEGAGHGWDTVALSFYGGGLLLPDPAGPGRLRARPDAAATQAAASRLAQWMEDRWTGTLRSARR